MKILRIKKHATKLQQQQQKKSTKFTNDIIIFSFKTLFALFISFQNEFAFFISKTMFILKIMFITIAMFTFFLYQKQNAQNIH